MFCAGDSPATNRFPQRRRLSCKQCPETFHGEIELRNHLLSHQETSTEVQLMPYK